MVSGEEAVAIGLATKVADDPRAAALELAGELAARSPMAVRQGKRLLDLSTAPGRTAAEQFLDERSTMASLIGSPGNVEAVTAYFEQRDPVFADPS
jgi:enoyl-CoA hydratase/carnithine racemase